MKRLIGLFLAHLPVVFGTAYILALLVFGVLDPLSDSPALHLATGILLIGYGLLIVVTACVLTVFTFRHGSVGLKSFRAHLRDDVLRFLAGLLWSMGWPLTWYGMIRNYRGWGMTWFDIAVEPTLYLIGTRRHGHRVDTLNFTTGTSDTRYLK